mgnify:FL=1
MSHPMKQLTLRNIDADIAGELETMVREEGLSLNQAALKLLRRGLNSKNCELQPIGNSLEWFIGSLSAEEASEFESATESTRRVDPDWLAS